MSQLDLLHVDAAPPAAVRPKFDETANGTPTDNPTANRSAAPRTPRQQTRRMRPQDAHRWHTASALMDAAREHLRLHGASKPVTSVFVVEDRDAGPLREVVDQALACAVLIPCDPDELATRWRTYVVVIDVLQTALATTLAPWAHALADLRALLSDRVRIDLFEDLLPVPLGQWAIPDELHPFKLSLYRLAVRAGCLPLPPSPATQRSGDRRYDFVGTRLGAARFVPWHAATGLLGTGDTLHRGEIERFLPEIVEDARRGDRGALTALVTYCTATMPRHFRLIGAREGGPFTAYFTHDFAVLNWSSRRLHPNAPLPDPHLHCHTTNQFFAPQPVDVAALIRRTCPPGAATLHDAIYGGDDLTSLASAYLQKFRNVGRGLTLERLAQSLPRLVGAHAADKTIGAAAYADFTLVSAAKFHYLVAPAARVNEACRAAFAASGFSGALAHEPSCDAALNPHLSDAAIAGAINRLADRIFTSIRSCGSRARRLQLQEVHVTVSCDVAALVELTTGMRPRKKLRLNMRSLNLDLGTALLHDKACTPYERRRLVALPAIAVAVLRMYLKWLERLVDSDYVPAQVRARLRSALEPWSTAPLFFALDTMRPLSGRRVAKALARAGIPRANDGRRVVERLARQGGASRAAVDAVLGHTPQGCEPFASYSALRPVDVIRQVQKAMNLRLREMGVHVQCDRPVRRNEAAEEPAK